MPHPSYNEELTSERDAHYETLRSFVRIYGQLKREGLVCFDENGLLCGHDGQEIISLVLQYFLAMEMYEWCAVLRDLLVKYRGKFRNGKKDEEWYIQATMKF